jgi:hypothetical protein
MDVVSYAKGARNSAEIAALTQQLADKITVSKELPALSDGSDNDIWVVVPKDYGLDFNGSSTVVTIPDANQLDLATAFTIEANIDIDALPSTDNMTIFEKPTNFVFDITSSGVRLFGYKSTDQTTCGMVASGYDTAITIGKHHVAGTYNAGTFKVYIDGVLKHTEVTEFATLNVSVTDARIGSRVGNVRIINGRIGEVRLWNVERTVEQILANKDILLEGDETGLVGYWRMDEGYGTKIYDKTTNEADGTIGNGSWVEV